MPAMRAVDIEVLENELSEYVRLAESGETVLVTDRDRVVAELGPPGPRWSPLASDARLAETVRTGWLTPAVLPTGDVPPRAPVAPTEDLLAELDSDRADR